MTRHTTARAVAVAAGCLATAGALAILTSDALQPGGHWTLDHALTPIVVGLALTAGHLAPIAARELRLLSAAGWAVLFCAATALTVNLSVGRQAAATGAATHAAEDVNARRAGILQRQAEAREILEPCPRGREADKGLRCGLREAQVAECRSGAGKRCQGLGYSIGTYEAAIRGYDHELAGVGPEQTVAPRAEIVAAAIVTLFGGGKAAIKERLTVLEPFAVSLVLEIGALVAFGYGFGGQGGTIRKSPAASMLPNGSGGRPRRLEPQAERSGKKARAEADIVTLLAMGRTVPSQQALAERWGVSKSTVSDWMRNWDQRGLTRRTVVGRTKMVRAG